MDGPRQRVVIWSVDLVLTLVASSVLLRLADQQLLAGDPGPGTVLAFKLLFIVQANLIVFVICKLSDAWRDRPHVIRIRLPIPF